MLPTETGLLHVCHKYYYLISDSFNYQLNVIFTAVKNDNSHVSRRKKCVFFSYLSQIADCWYTLERPQSYQYSQKFLYFKAKIMARVLLNINK